MIKIIFETCCDNCDKSFTSDYHKNILSILKDKEWYFEHLKKRTSSKPDEFGKILCPECSTVLICEQCGEKLIVPVYFLSSKKLPDIVPESWIRTEDGDFCSGECLEDWKKDNPVCDEPSPPIYREYQNGFKKEMCCDMCIQED